MLWVIVVHYVIAMVFVLVDRQKPKMAFLYVELHVSLWFAIKFFPLSSHVHCEKCIMIVCMC
jgi:hypothetical protein